MWVEQLGEARLVVEALIRRLRKRTPVRLREWREITGWSYLLSGYAVPAFQPDIIYTIVIPSSHLLIRAITSEDLMIMNWRGSDLG